jgi:hypothetical protein
VLKETSRLSQLANALTKILQPWMLLLKPFLPNFKLKSKPCKLTQLSLPPPPLPPQLTHPLHLYSPLPLHWRLP